jgi:hypothetical protein
MSTLNY